MTAERVAAAFQARLRAGEPSSSTGGTAEPDVHRHAASLLLASKVTEESVRLRDVINSAHRQRGQGVLSDSRAYWEQKEALLRDEQQLLRDLAFDIGANQESQGLLLSYLRIIRAPRSLCELSCALLNDSAGAARLASCPPNLLAAAAIQLASTLLQRPVTSQTGSEAERWWVACDVEEDALASTCHLLLDMYAAEHRGGADLNASAGQADGTSGVEGDGMMRTAET